MDFRRLSARVLEPAAMYTMVGGIIALVQPWNLLLHRYGITITLIGLVGFIVFSHIPAPEKD
ncbi:MAG: hypothetical protein ACE5Q3_11290 [Alphaproteobacteria bacterium]